MGRPIFVGVAADDVAIEDAADGKGFIRLRAISEGN
jgi:hypothetical protein